jgi:uncharacterized membrane protein YgcG
MIRFAIQSSQIVHNSFFSTYQQKVRNFFDYSLAIHAFLYTYNNELINNNAILNFDYSYGDSGGGGGYGGYSRSSGGGGGYDGGY